MEGFDEIGGYIDTDETGNYIVINTDESYGRLIEYRITWYRTLSTGATTEEDYYVPRSCRSFVDYRRIFSDPRTAG